MAEQAHTRGRMWFHSYCRMIQAYATARRSSPLPWPAPAPTFTWAQGQGTAPNKNWWQGRHWQHQQFLLKVTQSMGISPFQRSTGLTSSSQSWKLFSSSPCPSWEKEEPGCTSSVWPHWRPSPESLFSLLPSRLSKATLLSLSPHITGQPLTSLVTLRWPLSVRRGAKQDKISDVASQARWRATTSWPCSC